MPSPIRVSIPFTASPARPYFIYLSTFLLLFFITHSLDQDVSPSSRTCRPAHFLTSSLPHFLTSSLPHFRVVRNERIRACPIRISIYWKQTSLTTVYRFFLLPQFQISNFQQSLNKKHCHPGLDPGSKIHYSITIYLRFGHRESSGRITKGFYYFTFLLLSFIPSPLQTPVSSYNA